VRDVNIFWKGYRLSLRLEDLRGADDGIDVESFMEFGIGTPYVRKSERLDDENDDKIVEVSKVPLTENRQYLAASFVSNQFF
jgi:hypothetical protein